MKRKRRKHTAEFKARVAFGAIQGLKTQSEIAKEFEIHPVMVGQWKNELIERMPELFAGKADKDAQAKDKEKVELERKVGQLTMEVAFLEKKCNQLGIPLKGRNT
ncbi:transposase [Desulfopila aestuarii]|uniref:Transposase n=1 Tax=Desulfopila aestuarii DSM 18488 TaxID=1121416 RepID=A0A1M7YKG0_9BACT|nr:transposase [Desulfopila aestuarii]SHO53056.1 Transposase [Desulfopila aestuarii DSM 18488]